MNQTGQKLYKGKADNQEMKMSSQVLKKTKWFLYPAKLLPHPQVHPLSNLEIFLGRGQEGAMGDLTARFLHGHHEEN